MLISCRHSVSQAARMTAFLDRPTTRMWSLRGVGAFPAARLGAQTHRRPFFVLHVKRSSDTDRVVLGLIVSRAVGNAVVRNQVRRRIKAIVRELAPNIAGATIVVRAHPNIVEHSFESLSSALHDCLVA
jgi:ribonuclease P protein component